MASSRKDLLLKAFKHERVCFDKDFYSAVGLDQRGYLKLHVLVDVDSGQTLDARMTHSEKHDSPVGKAMLKKNWGIARACDYNLKQACYVHRQEGLTAPWMFA